MLKYFIISFLIIIPLAPLTAAVDHSYDHLGISSISLSASSGKVIDGKKPDQILPLASLTKLMTAMVLIDLKLDFNKKITINAADMNHVNPYIEPGDITSKVNIRAGDTVRANDLWHAMLIASSNEAAAALARSTGLTKKQFAVKMNQKAKALGLKKTRFTEMSGIDPKNIGTAREMAIIARRAYQYQGISQASVKSSHIFKTINTKRQVGVYCRNFSLMEMRPRGMKVGFLTEAQNNVAIRLADKKKDRVIVVLHADTASQRNAEIKRLFR